jgi:hypothetical protein
MELLVLILAAWTLLFGGLGVWLLVVRQGTRWPGLITGAFLLIVAIVPWAVLWWGLANSTLFVM